MNFVTGKLMQDGGDTWCEGEGVRLKLTNDRAQRVAGKIGQDVVLGIRPEAMRLHAGDGYGEDPGHRVDVKANVIEPLGSSMDVYSHTSTEKILIARVPAESQVAPDTDVTLHMDMSRVHVFEASAHGLNLTLTNAAVGAGA